MRNTFKYNKFMELIRDTCRESSSRQLEMYLRNEAVLSFISGEKEILDVGCNWAILPIYLALTGHKVTAIDINRQGLGIAAEIARRYRADITLKLCSGLKLDFPDESFDLVMWEEVLEHFDEPLQALREGRRVLRGKGRIILSVPNVDSLRSRFFNLLGLEADCSPEHKYHFQRDSLYRLVRAAGFRIVSFTSDFIPLPKLPLSFFLQIRKDIARRCPSLGHHLIICAEKEKS